MTKRTRLLLVDDHPQLLTHIAAALRQHLEVFEADSAAAALELLAREPVDVILSDYEMPGTHGIQLLEQVRARFPRVRRALFSGAADGRDIARDAGDLVELFLEKPAPTREILAAIEALIGPGASTP